MSWWRFVCLFFGILRSFMQTFAMVSTIFALTPWTIKSSTIIFHNYTQGFKSQTQNPRAETVAKSRSVGSSTYKKLGHLFQDLTKNNLKTGERLCEGGDAFLFLPFSVVSDFWKSPAVVTLSLPNILVQVIIEMVDSWCHQAAHTQQGLVSDVIWVKLLVMDSPIFVSWAGGIVTSTPVCRWIKTVRVVTANRKKDCLNFGKSEKARPVSHLSWHEDN